VADVATGIDSRKGNRPTPSGLRYCLFVSDRAGSPFGARLRQWRHRRGLSQLALAGLVGSTGRHISFLETGRSRPSRQMALRLADSLDVGLPSTRPRRNSSGT
jgi:DNA-binding XRE family transcriptional regulator